MRNRDGDKRLKFGYSLGDLFGEQIHAGLVLTGLFEDINPGTVLADHSPSFLATRDRKSWPAVQVLELQNL